jgi:hypothetical protein
LFGRHVGEALVKETETFRVGSGVEIFHLVVHQRELAVLVVVVDLGVHGPVHAFMAEGLLTGF